MLDEATFQAFRGRITAASGLYIPSDENSRYLLERRLAPRLRLRGLASYAEYAAAIDPQELEALLDVIAVHETYFFREKRQLDVFAQRIIPELARQERAVKIWSAGCSTGEEPYSIAITIADTLSNSEAWNVEILATDVGRQALKHAERGIYSGRSIAAVKDSQLASHFTAVKGGYEVKPRLKKFVTFTQMNLASAVYVGRMDVIFCMNVMIYFSEERRRTLVQRFYDSLEPGGYLFLGHSESISKMPVKFQAIVLNDCILYRKPIAEELLKPELVTEGRA